MRILGDKYAASEFRAHREVENPLHIVGFLTEWQRYAQELEGEGEGWRGGKFGGERLGRMSDGQVVQMGELMRAIKEGGPGEGEGEEGGEVGGNGEKGGGP